MPSPGSGSGGAGWSKAATPSPGLKHPTGRDYPTDPANDRRLPGSSRGTDPVVSSTAAAGRGTVSSMSDHPGTVSRIRFQVLAA